MRTGAVIDHAAFNAADPAWYVEFFRAVFGMEVVRVVRDETGALRQVWLDGGVQIDSGEERPNGLITHLSLRTPDMALAVQDALARGAASVEGKVIPGTVKGELHDIGKNLVRMMLEGKGLTVIDLGVDVPPEKFIEAAIENECSIICCSALLTTMPVMGEVVEKAVETGVRDKVKIMIGGAPVTDAFGQSINADAYTPDATTCAEVAMQLLDS